MICFSESYLDSSVSSDNDNLYIKDFRLVRADHPVNVERGGVCVAISKSKKVCNLDFAISNSLMQDISDANTSSKLKYERLLNKLSNPKTAPKTFANGSKIPLIPPLLVGNQPISDFMVKANLFNDYFSKECIIIDKNISIPANISFETEESFSTFEIYSGDIVKIIRSLDPNKAHGRDEISICMIKIRTSSISKPLAILFPKNGRKPT